MPTESFALSPDDVAARPPNDPLFVAENNPNLRGLENPELMRLKALILENLDGFDRPGVLRGVPHTLGMRFSIQPDKGDASRSAFPLANATGWSGDGAPPPDGSLRDFAVGAVVQHFPRDLLRRPNVDFRVPTRQELDNITEFMLSLGRQTQVSIQGDEGDALVFRDADVEAGRRLFLSAPSRNGGTRSCNGCHDEAGALDEAGNNRQFDTGVANRPLAPACLGDAPGDGGFGITPVVSRTIACANGTTTIETFRGNGQFNTPSLIEAADTAPLFHNNSAATIEDAVAHYTSEAFNASPAGGNNAFVLNQTQIRQVGAFLRALNSRDNTENAIRVLRRALREGSARQSDSIREALADTGDAISVIQASPLSLFDGSRIVPLLSTATREQREALAGNGARQQRIRSAIASLVQAFNLYTR